MNKSIREELPTISPRASRPRTESADQNPKSLGQAKTLTSITPSDFRAYILTLLAVAIATIIRLSLDPILGDRFPDVPYYFAIVFSGWYAGFRPAILAMVTSLASAAYFFLLPRGSFEVHGIESQVGVAVFIVVGFASALFSESLHAARRQSQNQADQLRQQQGLLEQELVARKELQFAYADLLRRSMDTHEEERRRLSRELHDQCGQDLTGLRLGVRFLRDDLDSAKREDTLRNLEDIIDRLTLEIQEMSLDLRPPSLDSLGLLSAIQNHLARWSQWTRIEVDFVAHGACDRRGTPEVETAVYRAVQEALTNVAKHSQSKRVSIVMSQEHNHLTTVIEDVGKGFDQDSFEESSMGHIHLGILGMKERIASVGGRMEIESSIGTGTTIFFRVPLIPTEPGTSK